MKKFIFFILLTAMLFSNPENNDLLKKEEPQNLGLVLSGGGAKGFAHIGVLKVLDEEKVPVDYLVGTSMGSIVGALYSMGYSAKEIEAIVLSKNWFKYFNDSIPRKEKSIDDKFYKDKYAFSFPVQGWNIKLPKGVIKGQNIENFLSELYFDATEVKDFTLLPIPFACVTTDIETGKEIVLKNGSIPEAVRASMAIPTVFSPVEIDGRLLIDGMMSKNFPVKEALGMGATYIIGSDVGVRLKKKEELNSFLSIMDQTSNYRMVEMTDTERKNVDLLITPKTEKYLPTDFNKAAEIIKEGEKAAREKIEEIRKYRNEKSFDEIKAKKLKKIDDILVEEIEITGNQIYDDKIIKEIMNLKLPTELKREELTKLMEKLYNLGLFEKVNYKINGSVLQVKVEEAPDKELKLGFDYNSLTQGEFFINGITKGLGKSGSRTSVELVVGKDETVKIQNTLYIGTVKKLGLVLSGEMSNVEDYPIFINDKRVSEYDINLANIDLMIGSFLSNRSIIGAGMKREFISAKSQIESNLEIPEKVEKDYGAAYFKYIYDSMDNKYFPKEGSSVKGEIIFSDEEFGNADFTKYNLKFNKAFKLNKNLVFSAGGEEAVVYGNNIPETNTPAIGGIYSRQNSIDFWGLEPSRYFSNKIYSYFGELFYEFNPSRYLILRYNGALLEDKNDAKTLSGGGIGIGASTVIGPLEFILSLSNHKDMMAYINVGLNF